MRYLALIYSQEVDPSTVSPEEMGQVMDAYNAFGAAAEAAGVLRGGEALQPTTMATTVRIRDGQRTTTDGPFAETKEALGGFYVLEAADLDEAIAYAAMIPGAKHGSIEVRPIFDFASAAVEAAAGASSGAN